MPLVSNDVFRFTIDGDRRNHLRWADLVVAWIKGEKAHPKTITELRAQCDGNGIDYSMPADLEEDIIVLQGREKVMTMRLPAAELYDQGHDLVKNGVPAYAIPGFYLEFFECNREDAHKIVRKPLSGTEAQELHALRTSEYAINGCA